jgi:hypothetical protein
VRNATQTEILARLAESFAWLIRQVSEGNRTGCQLQPLFDAIQMVRDRKHFCLQGFDLQGMLKSKDHTLLQVAWQIIYQGWELKVEVPKPPENWTDQVLANQYSKSRIPIYVDPCLCLRQQLAAAQTVISGACWRFNQDVEPAPGSSKGSGWYFTNIIPVRYRESNSAPSGYRPMTLEGITVLIGLINLIGREESGGSGEAFIKGECIDGEPLCLRYRPHYTPNVISGGEMIGEHFLVRI